MLFLWRPSFGRGPPDNHRGPALVVKGTRKPTSLYRPTSFIEGLAVLMLVIRLHRWRSRTKYSPRTQWAWVVEDQSHRLRDQSSCFWYSSSGVAELVPIVFNSQLRWGSWADLLFDPTPGGGVGSTATITASQLQKYGAESNSFRHPVPVVQEPDAGVLEPSPVGAKTGYISFGDPAPVGRSRIK